MTDFLLELLSEEIPARMQAKARADLERLFIAEIGEAGLAAESVTTYSTPRRLALIARGLPDKTEAVREERKGPKADAPDQAIEGFLRSTGLKRRDLETRQVKGKDTLFAVIDTPGRKAVDVLGKAIPAIIRAFPWPKSMRWGAASETTESLRWVRPLQGIVAIFGEELVRCEIDGIKSGYDTVGHRFHHDGSITIGGADDYQEKLRACHVIVDHKERETMIRARANELAAEAGLERVQDTALVEENAGLTEWPVPLLGAFDPLFLDVAPEAIMLAMRSHQKYFAVKDKAGALSPHFICVANLEAADGGAGVVAGNEKVLAARLSDARFFWEQDQKVPLEEHAKKLGDIVFHEKLGTVADKVERVAKLARWLVEEGIVGGSGLSSATNPRHSRESRSPGPQETSPAALDSRLRGNDDDAEELARKAETAARLAKADLVTGMVGEFADLQGIVGGYYAKAQGLDDEIASAIRDHYKPVGQGDDVPTMPVTVAVSLADKLDTLCAFFAVQERPTGSKDPYALRRAALATIRLIVQNRLRLSLMPSFDQADEISEGFFKSLWQPQTGVGHNELGLRDSKLAPFGEGHASFAYDLLDFFADRLKVQQREAGVRHDLIDAVFALGGEDDLVRLLARVKALQSFLGSYDGANLLAGYKRAANILKKEGWDGTEKDVIPAKAGISNDGAQPDEIPASAGMTELEYQPEPEEALLRTALDAAEPKVEAAIEAEDFEGAMAALASLREPIDAFFENVTVNDEDPVKRAARLALLEKVRDAVHRVADFSKIEG
ncbi:MAG: glycine--tRNA ligase subunit beta [Sphingomonadaceae bacterium]|nr:glycine--tRNA ligase subunit beta [Sphingomonadaceae bacterium]